MKKNILTHCIIIVVMLVLACVYMAPALSGKIIRQGDIQKADAMAYSQKQIEKKTGETPNWAPSMFSGMPGYQITTSPQHSVFQPLRNLLIMRPFGVERNIGVLFLYLLGFYVAMVVLGVSPWLALVGAIGFGLASYNIIIIEAGHITKAWAMSMMAPILAGMLLVLRTAVDDSIEKSKRWKNIMWGSILFTLALILQISYNHIQITFYTAIACVVMAVAYLVYAIVKRRVLPYAGVIGVLVVCAGLSFGSNIRLLLVNEEYSRYTMRGGNELSIKLSTYDDGASDGEQMTSEKGLDIDYAFNWSYGKGETYTVLVPGALGGGSMEKVSNDSDFARTFRTTTAPLYWGEQPFTSGPVYFGAIIILLALLGLFVTKGPERWWLLATAIIGVLLSWGHNLMGLNGWLFNHIPFYNKFRTPSMALVLSNVCMVILAVLTLKSVFAQHRDRKRINRGLYISAGLLTVVILAVMLVSSGFEYSGSSDRQMAAQYGNNWSRILSLLQDERAALLHKDSWRSIAFILLTAAVLWLFNNDKLKKRGIAVALVGVLVFIDLWGVDRRYLNNDNFTEKRKLELRPSQYDKDIDNYAAYFNDHDYRVLNIAVNTFNDSKPSAFHNQIGGYSAAKLSRYQNIIDFYFNNNIEPNVLNMLNGRYIVVRQGGNDVVQRNPDAMGNAWIVESVVPVGSANEEILALKKIDIHREAIVDTTIYSSFTGRRFKVDSAASIELVPSEDGNPDYLKYRYKSNEEAMVVFSEIHYAPDWFAYIDGQKAEYVRANYVLRAMVVPAGEHTIEFRNEAPRLHRLDTVTLIVSLITLLAIVGAIVLYYKRGSKEDKRDEKKEE